LTKKKERDFQSLCPPKNPYCERRRKKWGPQGGAVMKTRDAHA